MRESIRPDLNKLFHTSRRQVAGLKRPIGHPPAQLSNEPHMLRNRRLCIALDGKVLSKPANLGRQRACHPHP